MGIMGFEPISAALKVPCSTVILYTHKVQTKGLEPLTVGLEIRCANPLRHVCIKVGMMGIEPIFTLLGPTAYKAVALTC